MNIEFNPLVKFKDGIIEWSILNESDVYFTKSDILIITFLNILMPQF